MSNYHTVYIGLGSNLDNPQKHIEGALESLNQLPQSQHLRCSHCYGSKAIGPGDQADYINAAVSIETQLSPLELLRELQGIENKHGRQRNIRWGARTLDLDLLLYDNICLDTPELQLPHPEMLKRNFVLYPLNDLAPELVFPNGQTLLSLMESLSMTGLYQITTDIAL